MNERTDSAKSLEFLQFIRPLGPWVLAAIPIDRMGIEVAPFTDDSFRRCLRWIETYNKDHNIYYTLNPVISATNKKPSRENISQVEWLHVDLDPRGVKSLAAEQRQLWWQLTKERPTEIPEPSFVVFSGGGYQAGWRLQDPIPVGGKIPLAEEAARYNKQLEILFGADNTHNVDRLLRLPGTINWPGAKKRRKGRVEALATVKLRNDYAYDVSLFQQSALVQSDGSGDSYTPEIEVGDVRRIIQIDDLDGWLGREVDDQLKVLLLQGNNPDKPYASRSEALFAACCEMVRAGFSDSDIYSAITDSGLAISESILERNDSHRYALRQIRRAKEKAIHPKLMELNERFSVVGNMGGRCRVMEEQLSPTGRPQLTFQSFADFRNRYLNCHIPVGKTKGGEKKMASLGAWWLQHPMRRQYDSVVFSPDREIEGMYNLWQGFAVDPKPGDCSLFLEHVKEHICSGNGKHYKYLMQWVATSVQFPAQPGQVAVVMRGGQGTGKGFFCNTLGRLFGRHYLQVSDAKHLVGNFNAHLRDVVLLFADEAFFAGDKKHAANLKALITEETLTLEAKGFDAVSSPNFISLLMASNENWVIPAGSDERRFFVLDVAATKQQNTKYFSEIQEQLDNGGYEALLFHLKTLDVSGFQVRNVPKTVALQEQKLMSMDSLHEWWYSKLVDGQLHEDSQPWTSPVRTSFLVEDYIERAKRHGVPRRATEVRVAMFLRKICNTELERVRKPARYVDRSGRLVETRTWHWIFPNLKICRKAWVKRFGPTRWPAVDKQFPHVVETPF